ncbi:hypothetical protein [Hoeflea ulvae]|uniref:Uncharacterized protein n=1 Tax=Hoeflea ulvae TaxID=2983764 RepID=A0ABT3YM55_9HYPH|nr:hypothetical protein [Hoeflea ulvae]MCY0096973.1 hypothetical protein [Hoeflea ulvae]
MPVTEFERFTGPGNFAEDENGGERTRRDLAIHRDLPNAANPAWYGCWIQLSEITSVSRTPIEAIVQPPGTGARVVLVWGYN